LNLFSYYIDNIKLEMEEKNIDIDMNNIVIHKE